MVMSRLSLLLYYFEQTINYTDVRCYTLNGVKLTNVSSMVLFCLNNLKYGSLLCIDLCHFTTIYDGGTNHVATLTLIDRCSLGSLSLEEVSAGATTGKCVCVLRNSCLCIEEVVHRQL